MCSHKRHCLPLLFLLLLSHSPSTLSQPAEKTPSIDPLHYQPSRSSCYDERTQPQRCVPDFINVAFNLEVEVTNTCGVRQPTRFCVQTGHIGMSGTSKVCDVCDSRVSAFAHPRPESFIIYKKSNSSDDWIPWQYYSGSCRSTFKLQEKTPILPGNEAVSQCTRKFSDISPPTGGNIAFSTLEGRPNRSPITQITFQQTFRTIIFVIETCTFAAYLGLALFTIKPVFRLMFLIASILFLSSTASVFPLSGLVNRFNKKRISLTNKIVMCFDDMRKILKQHKRRARRTRSKAHELGGGGANSAALSSQGGHNSPSRHLNLFLSLTILIVILPVGSMQIDSVAAPPITQTNAKQPTSTSATGELPLEGTTTEEPQLPPHKMTKTKVFEEEIADFYVATPLSRMIDELRNSHKRIENTIKDLDNNIKGLKKDLDNNIKGLKKDLDNDIKDLSGKIDDRMFYKITLIFTILGVGVAIYGIAVAIFLTMHQGNNANPHAPAGGVGGAGNGAGGVGGAGNGAGGVGGAGNGAGGVGGVNAAVVVRPGIIARLRNMFNL